MGLNHRPAAPAGTQGCVWRKDATSCVPGGTAVAREQRALLLGLLGGGLLSALLGRLLGGRVFGGRILGCGGLLGRHRLHDGRLLGRRLLHGSGLLGRCLLSGRLLRGHTSESYLYTQDRGQRSAWVGAVQCVVIARRPGRTF